MFGISSTVLDWVLATSIVTLILYPFLFFQIVVVTIGLLLGSSIILLLNNPLWCYTTSTRAFSYLRSPAPHHQTERHQPVQQSKKSALRSALPYIVAAVELMVNLNAELVAFMFSILDTSSEVIKSLPKGPSAVWNLCLILVCLSKIVSWGLSLKRLLVAAYPVARRVAKREVPVGYVILLALVPLLISRTDKVTSIDQYLSRLLITAPSVSAIVGVKFLSDFVSTCLRDSVYDGCILASSLPRNLFISICYASLVFTLIATPLLTSIYTAAGLLVRLIVDVVLHTDYARMDFVLFVFSCYLAVNIRTLRSPLNSFTVAMRHSGALVAETILNLSLTLVLFTLEAIATRLDATSSVHRPLTEGIVGIISCRIFTFLASSGPEMAAWVVICLKKAPAPVRTVLGALCVPVSITAVLVLGTLVSAVCSTYKYLRTDIPSIARWSLCICFSRAGFYLLFKFPRFTVSHIFNLARVVFSVAVWAICDLYAHALVAFYSIKSSEFLSLGYFRLNVSAGSYFPDLRDLFVVRQGKDVTNDQGRTMNPWIFLSSTATSSWFWADKLRADFIKNAALVEPTQNPECVETDIPELEWSDTDIEELQDSLASLPGLSPSTTLDSINGLLTPPDLDSENNYPKPATPLNVASLAKLLNETFSESNSEPTSPVLVDRKPVEPQPLKPKFVQWKPTNWELTGVHFENSLDDPLPTSPEIIEKGYADPVVDDLADLFGRISLAAKSDPESAPAQAQCSPPCTLLGASATPFVPSAKSEPVVVPKGKLKGVEWEVAVIHAWFLSLIAPGGFNFRMYHTNLRALYKGRVAGLHVRKEMKKKSKPSV